MLIRMDDSTDLTVYSDCKDTLFSKLYLLFSKYKYENGNNKIISYVKKSK